MRYLADDCPSSGRSIGKYSYRRAGALIRREGRDRNFQSERLSNHFPSNRIDTRFPITRFKFLFSRANFFFSIFLDSLIFLPTVRGRYPCGRSRFDDETTCSPRVD